MLDNVEALPSEKNVDSFVIGLEDKYPNIKTVTH